MSSIKDQVIALTERLKTLPSEHIVKVAAIFVTPARDYWAAQSLKHFDVMNTYPEGSSMRKAAEGKYSEAFGHWHRLNFLVMQIGEAQRFKGLGFKLAATEKAVEEQQPAAAE